MLILILDLDSVSEVGEEGFIDNLDKVGENRADEFRVRLYEFCEGPESGAATLLVALQSLDHLAD